MIGDRIYFKPSAYGWTYTQGVTATEVFGGTGGTRHANSTKGNGADEGKGAEKGKGQGKGRGDGAEKGNGQGKGEAKAKATGKGKGEAKGPWAAMKDDVSPEWPKGGDKGKSGNAKGIGDGGCKGKGGVKGKGKGDDPQEMDLWQSSLAGFVDDGKGNHLGKGSHACKGKGKGKGDDPQDWYWCRKSDRWWQAWDK
jgi:hypothetical protein